MFLYISVMFRQFALYFMFHGVFLCYVSDMFGSLLSILCFMVCFMLRFCYVLQFALYFMFLVSLYVLFPVCFTVCFLFDVLCFVLCFAYVTFLLKFWIMLCLGSMFLLCFRFMFLFFLLCFWLNLVYVLFFLHVSVMCVMLVCFLLCFLLSFHSVLQSFFCFNMYCVEFWFVFFCVSVGFLFICFVAAPNLLFLLCSPSNLPSQLASELGSLQLVSQDSQVCREKKHLGQILASSSSEYGPVRSFDHLSRDVLQFSAQQDCIGRRTAARHLAPPSVTPVWKPLDSKETVSTKWANLGDRS